MKKKHSVLEDPAQYKEYGSLKVEKVKLYKIYSYPTN